MARRSAGECGDTSANGRPGSQVRSRAECGSPPIDTLTIRLPSIAGTSRGTGTDGACFRDVGQCRRLQLEGRRVFEGGGNLENELAAICRVHVKIAFALAWERDAKSPAIASAWRGFDSASAADTSGTGWVRTGMGRKYRTAGCQAAARLREWRLVEIITRRQMAPFTGEHDASMEAGRVGGPPGRSVGLREMGQPSPCPRRQRPRT